MHRRSFLASLALGPAAARAAARWPYRTLDGGPPIVIAHRGASGARPEHTLAAYQLAIEMGADFIEPDLVITRDGVLVARHEAELSLTTDVAARAEFAGRRRRQRIDGRDWDGWFVEDFTLAQRRAAERTSGRPIGIYPETKHAAHFAAQGLALEERLVDALHGDGLRSRNAPVFLQSFEPPSLQRLAQLTELPRVQLAGERARLDVTPVARYAQGLGVAKALVLPRDAQGRLGEPTGLVAAAHAAGLAVHVWTVRVEDEHLPADLKGQPAAEIERFAALGIDGLFTDHPDLAVATLGALARR
ncbi:MAG: glycerophosphodiester phosphodiesterase family protein [Betaproteobacteria bacterium]